MLNITENAHTLLFQFARIIISADIELGSECFYNDARADGPPGNFSCAAKTLSPAFCFRSVRSPAGSPYNPMRIGRRDK